jgi:hypothetical protein
LVSDPPEPTDRQLRDILYREIAHILAASEAL